MREVHAGSRLVINDDVHMLVGGIGIKGRSPEGTSPTQVISPSS